VESLACVSSSGQVLASHALQATLAPMRHDAYRDARIACTMLATHAVGTPYHLLILALGRAARGRQWRP